MKKILITGGAGFIGSHLCEKLANEGHEVHCLDNLYTGTEENVKHIKGLVFHKMDIIELKPQFFGFKLDEIYNLACPASPVHYQKDPIFTWKTNVLGTLNLLELARLHEAKFLQASTSEVYGEPLVHPQKESLWTHVNPVGIRSCYDIGKAAAETITIDYIKQYKLNAKIVRIFNTYGPRMAENDGRVVSNFIVQALKGKDITMYGDGSQSRSFCYVLDLIEGLVKMMNQPTFVGPCNLGNPNEFTIKELADIILELTNSKSKIIKKELPADDPTQRCPDITLANEVLNWKPIIQLRDGLTETIEYFNGKRNKESS